MNRLSGRPKAKRAAKRPNLTSKKLPTEKRRLSQKEQNRLDANLLIAAANGWPDDARRMLKAGANIEARDKNGWTALMYAAQHGFTQICKLLLEKGASISEKDNDGDTALIHAGFYSKTETSEFLRLYSIRKMLDREVTDRFISSFHDCIGGV